MHSEISKLLNDVRDYPFLQDLVEPNETLERLSLKKAYFSDEFEKHIEPLLDMKEDVLDPIRSFMNGSQKRIYTDARQFLLKQDPNFGYIDAEEVEQLRETLTNPKCYRGRGMQNVKSWQDTLQKKIDIAIDQHRYTAIRNIESKANEIKANDEFAKLTDEQKSEIEAEIDRVIQSVNAHDLLAMIKDLSDQFEESIFPGLLTRIHNWNEQDEDPDKPVGDTKPSFEIVNARKLDIQFDRSILASENDVDDYLSALKQSMIDAINEGKRIQV